MLLGELSDVLDGDDGAALHVQVGVVLGIRQPRCFVGGVHLTDLKHMSWLKHVGNSRNITENFFQITHAMFSTTQNVCVP